MRDSEAQTASPRARFALQAVGVVLLTGFLIPIFAGDRGLLLLEVLLGGICALWLFKEPHCGVLLILSLWFLEFSPVFLGIKYLRIPYLISALLLIPLVLAILRDREIWVWRVPQIKILGAIGLLYLASIGWSYYQHPIVLLPELDQTGEMLQRFVTRFAFLVFFLYFITTIRKIRLSLWVLLGLIFASAMSATYNLMLPGAHRAWSAFGPGSNPNSLAFLSLFGASLLWFYYSGEQSKRWKHLILVLLAPLPILAIASGSRGGFLQLLIFSALVVKEQEGWSAAKRIRSLLLLGSISLLFLAIIPASSLLRATTFEASYSSAGGESLSNRITTITAAFEMIASNPVLGVGLGNFRWMHQINYGSDLAPHNSYIGALLSGGVGCLALYLLLFYVTYQMLKRLEKSGLQELLWVSKGLRINLILFLIASISDDIWLNDFLYLIIGLAVVMTRVWQSQYQRFTGEQSAFNYVQAG
jgi:O-antigen ligase